VPSKADPLASPTVALGVGVGLVPWPENNAPATAGRHRAALALGAGRLANGVSCPCGGAALC